MLHNFQRVLLVNVSVQRKSKLSARVTSDNKDPCMLGNKMSSRPFLTTTTTSPLVDR